MPHLLTVDLNIDDTNADVDNIMVAPRRTRYNNALLEEQTNTATTTTTKVVESQYYYKDVKDKKNQKKNKPNKKGRRRRNSLLTVEFSSSPVDNKIHLIESCKDFTREEIQNCYLSQKELEDIKLNIRLALTTTIDRDIDIDENDHNDDHEEELRGLESYVSKNKYLTKVNHLRECRQAILKQQQELYSSGKTIDERWLLYNYQTLTEQAMDLAYQQGLKDQQCDPASPPFHQTMER